MASEVRITGKAARGEAAPGAARTGCCQVVVTWMDEITKPLGGRRSPHDPHLRQRGRSEADVDNRRKLTREHANGPRQLAKGLWVRGASGLD